MAELGMKQNSRTCFTCCWFCAYHDKERPHPFVDGVCINVDHIFFNLAPDSATGLEGNGCCKDWAPRGADLSRNLLIDGAVS